MAKQSATPTPGKPMVRNSRMVPAAPSRHSMNPSRKTEAKKDRQATVVQGSEISSPRAMAPPKLQTSAAPKTSSSPCLAAAARCGSEAGIAAWIAVSVGMGDPYSGQMISLKLGAIRP